MTKDSIYLKIWRCRKRIQQLKAQEAEELIGIIGRLNRKAIKQKYKHKIMEIEKKKAKAIIELYPLV